MSKTNITITIDLDLNEKLRKLSFFSRKTKSELIAEALELLMKTIKEKKDESKR